MANSIPYASQTAGALLGLVDIAGGDLSQQPYLPGGLNLVTTFSCQTISSGGVQGLWATGSVAGYAGPVAVLAVAAAWPPFLSYFRLPFFTETLPSASYLNLAGGNANQIATGYNVLYNALRGLVWNGLGLVAQVPGFTGSFPLLVVGMGPGGPLAQLAALDLRLGQTGPGAAASPVNAAACYSFSCPAYGSASYAAAAAEALGSVFLCNIPDRDFYPSMAGAPASFAASGVAQPLSALLPALDDPWLERTPAYYQAAFGQAMPALASGGTVSGGPAGFSGDLAYSLSLLAVAAYERFQHPNLGGPVPAGFQYAADIVVAGVTWGALYTAPGCTVAALRGPVSWVEGLQFYGNGQLAPLSWLQSGRILGGLAGFYPAFATALFAGLAGLPNAAGGKLYLTGHDAGGALAVLAGLDLVTTPRSGVPAPTALYGFGTIRFGDYNFAGRGYAPVAALSYQLVRPNDVIASMAGLSAMAPLPNLAVLSGGALSAANSTTGHALALYASLLNPQSLGTADGASATLEMVEQPS